MGSLVGLLLGLGLLVIWTARHPGQLPHRTSPSSLARLAEMIVRSGVQGVTPVRLIVASAGLGLAVAMSVLAISHVLTIAMAFDWFREREVTRVDLHASREAEPLYRVLGFVDHPDPSLCWLP